ncbi:MAG: hypothetical protein IIZ12_02185 [Eggerthellaceae bacterium]|nr:hypothetical protein [Eggerthellaceae bacterium]
MLAEMLAKHPGELYADFMQYYGVDFDKIRGEVGEIRTADLAAQLPPESRSFRALKPELAWTHTDWLMWSIEFSLRVLRWQNTEDGSKGRNKPQPLPNPVDRARIVEKVEATDMAYIAEQLNIELGGVDG